MPVGTHATSARARERRDGSQVGIALGSADVDQPLLTLFLIPDFGIAIKNWIVIPCAVAEIAMFFYLLFIGVCNPEATTAGSAGGREFVEPVHEDPLVVERSP
jgi:hypothetical protein